MEEAVLGCPWCSRGLLYRKKRQSLGRFEADGSQTLTQEGGLLYETETHSAELLNDFSKTNGGEFVYGCTNGLLCDGRAMVLSDSSLAFSGFSYSSLIVSFFKALDQHKQSCDFTDDKEMKGLHYSITELAENCGHTKMRRLDHANMNNLSNFTASSSLNFEKQRSPDSISSLHCIVREQPLLFLPPASTLNFLEPPPLIQQEHSKDSRTLNSIDGNTPVFYFLECSAGQDTQKIFVA